MTIPLLRLAALAPLFLAAASPPTGSQSTISQPTISQPTVALPPELARVLTDYEIAWQARDAAGLAALFAEDGFVLSSGEAPVRGRAAIERLYSGRGGPLSLRAIDYRTDGSVGYILGAFARHPGEADLGKFTLTLVRGVGGRWFIQSDMDNGNGAAGGAGGSAAARALLDRAIDAAGGRRALEASPGFRWSGTATVHAGGRDLALAGTWRLVPPQQARVETWEIVRGPDSTRTLILAGERGWTIKEGRPEPMTPAVRLHEAAQFHLYALMRLVTLNGPGCRLEPLAADAAGREGFRAACDGFPDADLYFDPKARLVRMVTRVTDPESQKAVVETVDLDGVIESRGVRWPQRITLAWDGAPYFDLQISEFEALKRIDPATFAPP